MPRPIKATIHLSALKNNYLIARKYGGVAKIWAVVKANAYGHGLDFAVLAFGDADGLALVEVDNAIKLRRMGWKKPILLLEGFFHASDLPLAQEHNIDVAVHCVKQIELLEQIVQANSADAGVINVHIKVNGGMNRLGFKPEDVTAVFQRLSAIKNVHVVDLMMHFANADDEFNPRLPVAEQLRRFNIAKAGIGDDNLDTSLSNSAANLLNPSIKNSWIRVGVMLYGGSPNGNSIDAFGLLPAMTLNSELIAIQEIQMGDVVGYGSRFVAKKAMRIGVVACGYADGYPRHAVDGTPILVNGVRTILVGRVSMDLITVDVTDIADATVGSPVTLWGRGLPIDDVAQAAETIGYELMCAVGNRVQLVADSAD
ncbi:MAG: alr [Solimicrobium sp.]|jgi:alanine racemase|nr:alr [Solimicrobium sp.]